MKPIFEEEREFLKSYGVEIPKYCWRDGSKIYLNANDKIPIITFKVDELNNKINITIYINNIQFEVIYNILSSEKWFNDNKEGKIKLTNKYNYIDNIDLYAANLLSKQEEIKAEKEKLRKKINAFNDSLKGDKLYSQYNISYSL